MLEKYYKYKISYKDYIIFIRVGNFYEIIDYDAFIINSICDLKLTKLSNTFKCGIPFNSIDKYTSILNEIPINYVVIDDEIKEIKNFDNNRYIEYDFDINLFRFNSMRITNIINYLNNNIQNNISDKLSRIEDIINE